MSDEITRLKQKILDLEFNLKAKTLDLKKCQATIEKRNAAIETQKTELKIQKLDFKTKMFSLESENADLRKRKDMTIADVMSSIPKITNKKKIT